MWTITVINVTVLKTFAEDMYDEGNFSYSQINILLFTSVWTILFLFYLFIASEFGRRSSENPFGRFSGKWIVFANDWLIGLFWFAGTLNVVSNSCNGDEDEGCGYILPNLILAILTWSVPLSSPSKSELTSPRRITFAIATFLSAAYIIRTRAEPPSKKSRKYQYWLLHRFNTYRLQRRISRLMSPKHYAPPTTKPSTQSSRLFARLLARSQVVVDKVVTRTERPLINDWAGKITSITVAALYIAFWGLYILWISFFCLDLSWYGGNGVDRHLWSFGQVVAITVWAQPLCEYIHLEFRKWSPFSTSCSCHKNLRASVKRLVQLPTTFDLTFPLTCLFPTGGMTRGFEHRLIWPYTVIRQDTKPASSNKSTSDLESGATSPVAAKGTMAPPSPVASPKNAENREQTPSGVVSMDDFADEAEAPLRGAVSEYQGAGAEWQAPDAAVVREGGSCLG